MQTKSQSTHKQRSVLRPYLHTRKTFHGVVFQIKKPHETRNGEYSVLLSSVFVDGDTRGDIQLHHVTLSIPRNKFSKMQLRNFQTVQMNGEVYQYYRHVTDNAPATVQYGFRYINLEKTPSDFFKRQIETTTVLTTFQSTKANRLLRMPNWEAISKSHSLPLDLKRHLRNLPNDGRRERFLSNYEHLEKKRLDVHIWTFEEIERALTPDYTSRKKARRRPQKRKYATIGA
jgi:hypothetical protein